MSKCGGWFGVMTSLVYANTRGKKPASTFVYGTGYNLLSELPAELSESLLRYQEATYVVC